MAGPSPDATDRRRLHTLLGAVRPVAAELLAAAEAHHDRLTKPRGSLGRLETLGAQLCAIGRVVPPAVPQRPAVAVFAGDHGVLAEGVSPWPQEVTAQMVANFCLGGAAINVLARRVGATTTVVDVGVATALPPGIEQHPALWSRRVRGGTDNLAVGPAMSAADALAALAVGAEVADALVTDGADLLVGGDMGIGNTTASAALVALFTGTEAAAVTGRGTGIDDATWQRKAAVVAAAVARATQAVPDLDPLRLLAEVGGLEIAALCGFYLGGAAASVPVVVDGVIALAAACAAVALCPAAAGYLVAGHRSTEPGATAALAWLGLEPLLELGLRLGEGSGAALAVPLVQAAAAIMAEMATFDAAGVTDRPT